MRTLSEYAEKQNITYQTAYLQYKRGTIPFYTKKEGKHIYVDDIKEGTAIVLHSIVEGSDSNLDCLLEKAKETDRVLDVRVDSDGEMLTKVMGEDKWAVIFIQKGVLSNIEAWNALLDKNGRRIIEVYHKK